VFIWLQVKIKQFISPSRPQTWPLNILKRIDNYMAERFAFLGVKRDDKAGRQAVFSLNYDFFGAPVVIYLCMDKTLTSWSMFDVGAISQNIMLAAR
jgi:hypothetical protein